MSWEKERTLQLSEEGSYHHTLDAPDSHLRRLCRMILRCSHRSFFFFSSELYSNGLMQARGARETTKCNRMQDQHRKEDEILGHACVSVNSCHFPRVEREILCCMGCKCHSDIPLLCCKSHHLIAINSRHRCRCIWGFYQSFRISSVVSSFVPKTPVHGRTSNNFMPLLTSMAFVPQKNRSSCLWT